MRSFFVIDGVIVVERSAGHVARCGNDMTAERLAADLNELEACRMLMQMMSRVFTIYQDDRSSTPPPPGR